MNDSMNVHRLSDLLDSHFSGPSPTCIERNVRENEWGVLKTTCSTTEGWNWRAHKVLPPAFWNLPRLEVKSGDSIITKAGPRHRVGVASFVDFVPPQIVPSGKMICLRPNPRRVLPAYFALALSDPRTQRYLDQRTTGMAESQVNFENNALLGAPVWLPERHEQESIVEALTGPTAAVNSLERLIAKKRSMKQGIMQQLLTGNTRLPGFSGEWQSKRLSELLAYEQPGRYLVSSTDYVKTGIPVLTAGKTFLLGYTIETGGVYQALPVIIFDDFTTASKYVSFPFKAKSSAMKMLSAKPGADLRFVFERMQQIDFVVADHKRRWIAEFSKIEIAVPPIEEQHAISSVIEDTDDEIDALERRICSIRAIKRGMMQELLTGRTRLVPAEVAA